MSNNDHHDFMYEVTKRLILNSEDNKQLQEIALNLLSQNKHQRQLLDLWIKDTLGIGIGGKND